MASLRRKSNIIEDFTINKDLSAITYYFLSAPTLLSVLILTVLYFINLDAMVIAVNGIIPFNAGLDEITALLGVFLPIVASITSLYATFAFRPGLNVTVLTIFYLIVVSVSGLVDPFLASFIVFSAFTCLIGFNYSREMKIRGGRKTIVSSIGPGRYQLLTVGFDVVLPVLTVIGTVALIAYIMTMVQAQVNILPEPLGILGSLYLQSRLYLMLTTLSIAGAVVWMIRQFFEPILLRFTLTVKDARQYLLDQLSPEMSKIIWTRSWRPRINVRRVVFIDILLAIFVMVILISFGSGQGDELLKIFGIVSPQPNPTGYVFNANAKLVVRFWNGAILLFQDILRKVIKILWG